MVKTEAEIEKNIGGNQEQLLASRLINSFCFHVDFSIDIPIDRAKEFLADLTNLKIKWSG